MDNRVKERLTGALILVAAGVILVPEMFSGRPRAAADAEAPPAAPASEGPPLRSYTAELANADPAPAPATQTPPSPPPAPTTASSPPPVGESRPAPVRPPPPQSPPPSPAHVTSPATSARGGWYVQVGGFSQAANAERLATRLRSQGFGVSLVAPRNGNALTRVRVGPAADRGAAIELQQRLRASGHAGSLIAP